MTERQDENEIDSPEYKKSFDQAVHAIIAFGAKNFPELRAIDAAGVCLIAGTQIGQLAGEDGHLARMLRAMADELDGKNQPSPH